MSTLSNNVRFATAYGAAHTACNKLQIAADQTTITTADYDAILRDLRDALCRLTALRSELAGNPRPPRGELPQEPL